jgi:RimJ/RimL family protein N-acetyltransferase
VFAEPIGPVTLENDFVRLEPLCQGHAADLAELTVGTGLTRWFPQPLDSRDLVDAFIAEALELGARQQALPFVIIDHEGRVAGSTRFGAIVAEHRRVEIGWTFVGAAWQRGPVNTAAKLLLLTHAFERLGCLRVELKTDFRNDKSRAAIARIGATEEGIFRRHVICADGHLRDTVYFSILDDEWAGVKARLQSRLA